MKDKVDLEELLSVDSKYLNEKICAKDSSQEELGEVFLDIVCAEKKCSNNTNTDQLYSGIQKRIKRKKLFNTIKIVSAASVLLLIGLEVLYHQNQQNFNMDQFVEVPVSDSLKHTMVVSNEQKLIIKEKMSTIRVSPDGDLLNREHKTILFQKSKLDETFKTLLVPYGHQVKLYLSDSTEVILNAGSRLDFPSCFKGSNREVRLIGEAYFSVMKDERHPFIVKTPNVNISVLGTKFNITAYKDDNVTTTVLTEGEVVLVPEEKRIFASSGLSLESGEMGQFNRTYKVFEKKKVNTEIYTSWIKGYLIVDMEPLPDLFKRIGRYYNVQFIIQHESLKKQRYNGKLVLQNDVDEILQLISKTIKIEIERTGNKILIK